MDNRIKYIDGLKGFCGIWVCLFHYILAFFPLGYVGWGSGITSPEQYAYYFENFPLSILTNSTFPLYIFFALIAFIPALKFFRTGDDSGIKKQAVKRYFRLMPPALACALFSYAVYAFGGMFNQELALAVSSNWTSCFYTAELSLPGALRAGFFTVFLYGDSDYCSVLWCMNVILVGSYLSYAALMMFGKLRRRWIVYAVLMGLSVLSPIYTSFLAGIIAADIVVHRSEAEKPRFLGEILLILGLVLCNFPPVWMPNQELVFIPYALGSLFIIWGCAESRWMQRLLSTRWLCFIGRLSFSLILVHFTVLMSLSAWIFVSMREGGHGVLPATLISWGLSAPVILLLSWLFEKLIEQPAEKLASQVYKRLS